MSLTAGWQEIAPAALDFACQCDGVDGFEILLSAEEPLPATRGLLVRGGDIFRRAELKGRAWARLPVNARGESSSIYIIGTLE